MELHSDEKESENRAKMTNSQRRQSEFLNLWLEQLEETSRAMPRIRAARHARKAQTRQQRAAQEEEQSAVQGRPRTRRLGAQFATLQFTSIHSTREPPVYNVSNLSLPSISRIAHG